FFIDTASPLVYTLSLHDALPISTSSVAAAFERGSFLAVRLWQYVPNRRQGRRLGRGAQRAPRNRLAVRGLPRGLRSSARPLSARDRKSTRLNSSHVKISYAVFCL